MNFDADRTRQLAGEFSRTPRIAADLLAEHLGRLGLLVERRGLEASQPTGWVLGSTSIEPQNPARVVVLASFRGWNPAWSRLRGHLRGSPEVAQGRNLALLVELA